MCTHADKMDIMKTKSIAKAGLICAIYGMFVELDVLTGLLIETTFPYLFALPIFICALKEDRKISLSALFAMVILTFILTSLTTWVIAISMLLAGWCFGYCVNKQYSLAKATVVTFVVLMISSLLQITVLANLFGFTPESMEEFYQWVAPIISWQGLYVLLAGFEALLETVTIALMSVVIAFKIIPHKAIQPLKAIGHVPVVCVWVFTFGIAIWVLLILFDVQVEFWIKDVLLFAILFSLIGFIWNGCMILQRKAINRQSRILAIVVVITTFIPGINFIEAIVGGWDLMKRAFLHEESL